MPVISRIWARSALISAGLQPQQENWNPATGQRNWPTHPAVPPGTDDQNSTPARELEPPQPLLRSLDGGQHLCAKIGVRAANRTKDRPLARNASRLVRLETGNSNEAVLARWLCEHERGKRGNDGRSWRSRGLRCWTTDGGCLALRSRRADGGSKPPRGALVNDRRLERRGKRRGCDRVRCGPGR